MPFRAKYVFRPGFIQPLHGIKSRTTSYRVLYALLRPLFLLFKAVAPRKVTTTERLGRAMLNVTRRGFAKTILHTPEINEAAALGA